MPKIDQQHRRHTHRLSSAEIQQRGQGLIRDLLEGRRLFEPETFGGNGRTCETCHGQETGTVSPEDARQRFLKNRRDPLFVHDGSDDDFVFHNQAADVIDGNPDGIIDLSSPDPGRALITGQADDIATGTFDHGNAFMKLLD